MERLDLAAWLLERGDEAAVALVHGARTLTYGELRAQVVARAAEQALRPGAIVPLLGENSLELVVRYLAVLRAGAIPALVPPVTPASLRAIVAETAAPRDEDELALLLYTSGSTGAPKGVMISARNALASAEAIRATLPFDADERGYLGMPIYYSYGLSVLHTHLRAGATVVLGEAHQAEPILDELERHHVTGLAAVPTFFQLLLRRTTLTQRRLAALRYLMVAGGRLPDTQLHALRTAVPHAQLIVRYGATELTSGASYVPPSRLDEKIGSIGHGLPGLPIEVLREDGARVTPGSDEHGEIVVRGAHVALGYFKDEAATARVFRDGAFHTGDLARVDRDGFVFVLGRSTDFVKSGGHRISPHEVEDLIATFPGVAEVCVYGVSHPTRGEALAAQVVALPGQALTPAVLREACAAVLPAFKIPVELHVVTALPRTANGKLDRRTIATRAP